MNPSLPKGFISITDAVDLIRSETRDNPKVDVSYMAYHKDWIEEAHNFRIPLIKLANNKIVKNGSKYVEVRSSYDKEVLKKAILDKFRELAGHEFARQNVRAVSSVVDDEVATGARPRRSKPIAKEGQAIGTGETITTNGANL